jgi:hypothetical protein
MNEIAPGVAFPKLVRLLKTYILCNHGRCDRESCIRSLVFSSFSKYVIIF